MYFFNYIGLIYEWIFNTHTGRNTSNVTINIGSGECGTLGSMLGSVVNCGAIRVSDCLMWIGQLYQHLQC